MALKPGWIIEGKGTVQAVHPQGVHALVGGWTNQKVVTLKEWVEVVGMDIEYVMETYGEDRS
jgi:hypothetical protein